LPVAPTAAFTHFPPVHKTYLERVLRVETSGSLLSSGTGAPGGQHAYEGRVRKERNPRDSGHCIASANCPSPSNG
jgi:hypothetical protein